MVGNGQIVVLCCADCLSVWVPVSYHKPLESEHKYHVMLGLLKTSLDTADHESWSSHIMQRVCLGIAMTLIHSLKRLENSVRYIKASSRLV